MLFRSRAFVQDLVGWLRAVEGLGFQDLGFMN